ncbi:MAG: hypothetical protein ACNYPH_07215 [Gammaproteobacteria bacterium WSBS_2016_MAG_OTU1]
MTKVGLYLLIFATSLAGAFAGAYALLSLVCGVLVAMLPQMAMLAVANRHRVASALALWAGKFAISILLLVVAATYLHRAELMVAEYFVGGIMLAIVGNIALLAQRVQAN